MPLLFYRRLGSKQGTWDTVRISQQHFIFHRNLLLRVNYRLSPIAFRQEKIDTKLHITLVHPAHRVPCDGRQVYRLASLYMESALNLAYVGFYICRLYFCRHGPLMPSPLLHCPILPLQFHASPNHFPWKLPTLWMKMWKNVIDLRIPKFSSAIR